MKKLIFLLFALPIMFLPSCSEVGDDIEKSLAGTTWTGSYTASEMGISITATMEIKFTSSSEVSFSYTLLNETTTAKGTYTYKYPTVVITLEGEYEDEDEIEMLTLTVSGNKLITEPLDDGETITFYRK